MLYDSRSVADLGSNSLRPAVDAVVITWNRCELASECIEHLLASTLPVNVIVIDNGSEDGTPDRVRERFPEVDLVEFADNRGYGAAANAGAERATADFVAIINQDALVAPDYFELVLARMSSDERIGFASGLSIDPKSGKVDSAGAVFDSGLRWGPYFHGVSPEEVAVDEARLASPPTDSIVFRRSAFLDIGGFDSEIFAYGEDLDLTLRLREAGWLPASVTAALVEHLGAASMGKRSVGQMNLVGWGRGYVAGRYRVGPMELLLDLVMWTGISAIVRSPQPLRRLLAGLRRGRSLPQRPVPSGIYREHWYESLRKRRESGAS